MVFSHQSKTTTRQRCLAGRVFTLYEDARPARQKQDRLRPNSLVGEGKAETVSCSTFICLPVSERPTAGKPPQQPPLLPSNNHPTRQKMNMVQLRFVLPLSDHVCLVVAGPGEKVIIEMHRFNFFCRCLALV